MGDGALGALALVAIGGFGRDSTGAESKATAHAQGTASLRPWAHAFAGAGAGLFLYVMACGGDWMVYSLFLVPFAGALSLGAWPTASSIAVPYTPLTLPTNRDVVLPVIARS